MRHPIDKPWDGALINSYGMHSYLHIGRASDLTEAGDRRLYRLLEILPGFLAWITLVLVVLLSFLAPVFMAVFVIVFDIYWLIKTLYLLLHLRASYSQLKKNLKINWLARLESLPTESYTLQPLKSWQDIYHLVFLPIYKEGSEVLEATLEGLLKSNYPKSKMAVILCWEERGGSATGEAVRQIESSYKDKFFHLSAIMHPVGLEGELPGKSSNTSYAAQKIKTDLVDRLGIPYSNILVSNFDIDTIVFPEYFGVLTYRFLTTPNPLRASYQPVPFYTNNIWEAPSLARVVAFGTTFWYSINQEQPDRSQTFSSHSMPWQALVDVGFWQKNMVNEDSRIFCQCYLQYDGDYRVVSLYYPVSMDANVGPTFWRTTEAIYKQQRRWAYGSENIPYLLYGFSKNSKIKRRNKWYWSFVTIEGFHSWATTAVILFVLGWLPVMVGGPAFNQTVLSLNLPSLTRMIMTLSMAGLISSAVLSIALLPPRPPKFGRLKYVWMILEWIIFPVSTILLGSLPSLEAQTRLMLGKYMGFWVTPKTRKAGLDVPISSKI